ncbi:MAG: Ig domain-containing protein, partial [Candidatus Dormibacteraceae bacterium]
SYTAGGRGVAVYAPAPTFTADTPPAYTIPGASFSYTYAATATAGIGPATFSLQSGVLPPGLALNPSTGQLSGTPTAVGTYSFVVRVQNAVNWTLGTANTIMVPAPPSAQISSPASGQTYTQGQAVATAFSCAEGSFGPGIARCADADGSISGAGQLDTATLGSHAYTVTATSADGQSASGSISYDVVSPTVIPPTPVVGALHQSDALWRPPHPRVRSRVSIGTTFNFTLNEAATVTLSFSHRVRGLRLHGRCVAATRQRARKCERTVMDGTLKVHGVTGANRVRFGGRLSHDRTLGPDPYTVTFTAVAGGLRSRAVGLRFTIVG